MAKFDVSAARRKMARDEALSARGMELAYLPKLMSEPFGTVGNPYGGAAFGERADPVSVVAVVTAVVEAAPMIAAIGTAISVVGMVTGSKDLTKIGGMMALVGGVTSLASGAFSATEGLASVGESGGAGATADTLTAGADGLSNTALTEAGTVAANSGASAEALIQANLGNLPSADTVLGNSLSSLESTGLPPASMTSPIADGAQMGIDMGSTAINSNSLAIPDVVGANTGISLDPSIGQIGMSVDPSYVSAAQKLTAEPSMLNKFLGFSQQNSSLMQDGGQLVGWAMGGMGKMYEADRNYDINKQMVDLRTQAQNTAIANANAQPDIASMMQANPNATPFSTTPVDPRKLVSGGRGLIYSNGR